MSILDIFSETPRQTKILLNVAGTDVSEALAASLTNFEYEESINSKVDTLLITCTDPQAVFRNNWPIIKGTPIHAKLVMLNWSYPGEQLIMDCRQMFIDAIDFNLNPRTFTVKATSLDPSFSGRGTHKFDASEGKSLEQLGLQVAQANNLTLRYGGAAPGGSDVTYLPSNQLARSDKTEESDLEYYDKLCAQRGLKMKVIDGKLFVFNEAEMEAQAPFTTLTDRVSPLVTGRLRTSASGLFKRGKLSYTSPKSGKAMTHTFEPPKPPEGVGDEQNTHDRPDEAGDDDETVND